MRSRSRASARSTCASRRSPTCTPVSEADRAAEEAIRALVACVGPRRGRARRGVRRRGRRATWIVDPIDGTKNYVRGVPVWATLLALERGGRRVVAVVSAPALGRRWWAVRGEGAFADGARCRVSARRTDRGRVGVDDVVARDAGGLGGAGRARVGEPRLRRLLAALPGRRRRGRCRLRPGAEPVGLRGRCSSSSRKPAAAAPTFAGSRPSRTARASSATNGVVHDDVVSLLARNGLVRLRRPGVRPGPVLRAMSRGLSPRHGSRGRVSTSSRGRGPRACSLADRVRHPRSRPRRWTCPRSTWPGDCLRDSTREDSGPRVSAAAPTACFVDRVAAEAVELRREDVARARGGLPGREGAGLPSRSTASSVSCSSSSSSTSWPRRERSQPASR